MENIFDNFKEVNIMSKCKKCGADIPDNVKFCPECGAESSGSSVNGRIIMKCRQCSGTLTMDKEGDILVCPYCGSKELLLDSDNVAVEKIKQQTEFKKWEREDQKKKEEQEHKYKFGAFGVISIICAVFFGLMALLRFTSVVDVWGVLAGITALIGFLAFVASVMFRRGIIKTDKSYMATVIMIGGFLLFIPFFIFNAQIGKTHSSNNSSEQSTPKAEETTEAPKELTLPISSDEALKMDYEKLYSQFYEAGFTNADYYGLEDLTSSDDKLNGTISSVTVNGKDTFNKGDKCMSNAKIMINYHSVKTGNLPVDKWDFEDDDNEINYEDLITQFKKEGFTNISTRTVEDTSKTEGSVKDVAVDGKSILSDYIFHPPIDAKIVITYYTKAQAATQAQTKAASKTESKTESKAESKSIADSGIVTPSFKETMDSYEAFMDEYIAFMKKYKENPTDMELITEYTNYISKYSEYMNKINEIDKDELSDADLAYYTEVNMRVLNKLAEVE